MPPRRPRARARRHARFFALTGVTPAMRVARRRLRGRSGCARSTPDLDITGVDLVARPGYPGPFVQADVTERPALRRRRVRPRLLLQRRRAPRRPRAGAPRSPPSCAGSRAASTCRRPPSRSRSSRTRCCPFAHWLPAGRAGAPYWRLGAAGGWEDIALLRRASSRRSSPTRSCSRRAGRGPLAKSWIAIAPVVSPHAWRRTPSTSPTSSASPPSASSAGPLGYFAGGAGDERTLRDNVEPPIARRRLRPRVLVDVSAVSDRDDRAGHPGLDAGPRRARSRCSAWPTPTASRAWPAPRRTPARSCACRRSRPRRRPRSPRRRPARRAGSSSTCSRTAA